MTLISRLIHSAATAAARHHQRSYLDGIICGPDTTFRSELIEAMNRS